MTSEERLSFEKRLDMDPKLKKELLLSEAVNEVIIDAEALNIKAKLTEIHNTSNKGNNNYKKWLLGGAILIGLAGIVGISIPSDDTKKHKPSVSEPITEEKEAKAVTSVKPQNDSKLLVAPIPETTEDTDHSTEGEIDPIIPIIVDTVSEVITIDQPNENESANPTVEAIGEINKVKTPENELVDASDKKDGTADKPVQDMNAEPIVNPCEKIALLTPQYEVKEPCIGEELWEIELKDEIDNEQFGRFSIDGGKSYNTINSFYDIEKGTYTAILMNYEECSTKPIKINLNYANCNQVIQPNKQIYWELDLPELNEYPLTLEIRHARSGALVYSSFHEYAERIEWRGTKMDGTFLTLGNYVYLFTTKANKVLAKGQITILE